MTPPTFQRSWEALRDAVAHYGSSDKSSLVEPHAEAMYRAGCALLMAEQESATENEPYSYAWNESARRYVLDGPHQCKHLGTNDESTSDILCEDLNRAFRKGRDSRGDTAAMKNAGQLAVGAGEVPPVRPVSGGATTTSIPWRSPYWRNGKKHAPMEINDRYTDELLEMRQQARALKQWALSDELREELLRRNVILTDTKDFQEALFLSDKWTVETWRLHEQEERRAEARFEAWLFTQRERMAGAA